MQRHLIRTKKELENSLSYLTTVPKLSHDTETKGPIGIDDISGLYPFHGARSFSHIIASKDDVFYFDFNTGGINPKHKRLLAPIFEDPTKIVYYVNAVFDGCISYFDGIKFNQRIVDCPAIARIEFNKHGKGYSDESFLSMRYLANYYKVQQKNDAVKTYIEENNLYSSKPCRFTGDKIPLYNRVPLELMFEYGCDDALTTFELGEKILKCIHLKDKHYVNERGDYPPMLDVARQEVELTSVVLDMKLKGMRLWTDYVEKAVEHETKIYAKLSQKIDKETGGININSGKQLAEFLESKGVKLPVKDPTENDLKMANKWATRSKEEEVKYKETKKEIHLKRCKEYFEKSQGYLAGRKKTDKKTLGRIIEKHSELEFLQILSKAKEAEKRLNTYYKNFLLLKDQDDVIHCNLNQEKAITGRFSSSSPNLQNLNKEEWDEEKESFLVRKSFIAFEGFTLFFFDYSQMEMIVMIDQAEEMNVINKLKSGEFNDFYVATKEHLKESLDIEMSRYDTKQLSLSLAYGQGKDALAKNLKKTVNEAVRFKSDFFRGLPRLQKFQKLLQGSVKRYGKIHNPFGRVSYLDSDEAYKALNSFVQGTSADIVKKAMIACYQFLKPYKSFMSLTIHDEICFNIHNEEFFIIEEIKGIMESSYKGKHLNIKSDVEFSKINDYGVSSWGEKVAYEL